MDSITSCALEEICAAGPSGVPLAALWTKLRPSLSAAGLDICAAVKSAVWSALLTVPSVWFVAHGGGGGGVRYAGSDGAVQCLEEAEGLGLSVVAADHLRDSFVGLYDLRAADAGISQPQRRALGLLAAARKNGITQSQLAKEFGKNGNNMFFIVRNLESQGLVTRHSTIVWKKDAFHLGESSNTSAMNTNTVYLTRYAKHLGYQQRLEITKEDKSSSNNEDENDSAVNGHNAYGDCVKEEVLVGDFLPALKAVCDKLEAAYDRVLFVSDIKRDLGYQKSKGHRRWRNICRRLKDAGIVEEFRAEVNKKEASCLRLLKGFSVKHFEQKSFGSGDDNFEEHLIKFAQRHQTTDQFVELPIEHQIYDIIDAAGPTGLTLTEVCRRLGINNKRNYIRFLNMVARFGMILQAENCNRSKVYRVWTSRNFTLESSNVFRSISEDFRMDNGVSNAHGVDIHEKAAQSLLLTNHPTFEGGTEKVNNGEIEKHISQVHPADGRFSTSLLPSNPEERFNEPGDTIPYTELGLISTEFNDSPLDTQPSALDKPHRVRSYQTYPCLNSTPLSVQREQRILALLQEEKFILRPELHRWLESLEPDKHTVMDNKTLIRILNRLQKQGQCRCIDVSVPVATNFHRNRLVQVILQPSIQGLPPELWGQIQDRMRTFDTLVRREGSHRVKKEQSVPVLNHIQRISKNACPDVRASKLEIMHSNGFVNAKMVRAKLLHGFLWDYVNNFPGVDGPLSSSYYRCDLKNPHSACKLFVLSAAIKTIPFELFLQTIGSSQKFDNLIEMCNSGSCLSDLSEQDYNCLMDSQATERLSLMIDILRRMKLVRAVNEHSMDGSKLPNSTLIEALELKPYIEEPLSISVPSSNFISLDLRPRKRHDFILSDKNAVDAYWKTLEYCYVVADPTAALHAFPGSTVKEIFHQRSWAAVVMSAEQRAELVKRVVNIDPVKKLSFKDCEEIAKDLNLTLEQVLRMYYDRRRLSKSQRGLNSNSAEFQPLRIKYPSSSRKRKRSSEKQRSKHAEDVTENLKSVEKSPGASGEENLDKISSLELDNNDNLSEDMVDSRSCEEDKEHSSRLRHCAFQMMNARRQKKFSWTEEADRHLIIQYVRYRAAHGAKFNRVEWVSLHDLPAPPSACRRRMQLLNSNIKFRKSLMRICNMLSERYVKLDNKATKNLKHDDNSRSGNDLQRIFSDGAEHSRGSDFEEERWDNFDDEGIKGALDEALRLKQMDKLKTKRNRSTSGFTDLNTEAEECDPRGTRLVSSDAPSKNTQHHHRRYNRSGKILGSRAAEKYRTLLNEGISVDKQAYESLAVSNAVELFKLVFLSSSRAPQVPNLLAETLRRYSEHDLFTAWNYLREKKIMEVETNGTHVLSRLFLRSIFESPFPCGTGNTAAEFANWLLKREKDTKEEWIDLTADLQCGDIFHLFALISMEEFSIRPFLPEVGVGEDSKNSKRKGDIIESNNDNVAKRLKYVMEGDRKQKGFPGIVVSISRETISLVDGVRSFGGREICGDLLPFVENDPVSNTLCQTIEICASHSVHMEETPARITAVSSESPWEAMAGYAKRVGSIYCDQEQENPFHPELFRTIYATVQRAGDQGLSMKEVSRVLGTHGQQMPELVVDVLQAFGRVLKVNAYDAVLVVDSLYRPKYFLTSCASSSQNPTPAVSMKFPSNSGPKRYILHSDDNSPRDSYMKNDDVHRITILNHPEEVAEPLNGCIEEVEGCFQGDLGTTNELSPIDSQLSRPILPWINGDGSINMIVHKALTRRVFGTVMQNPGILEVDIIFRMDALNPQSCRQLLESMILDNHLTVRKMHQTTSGSPPAILGSLLGSNFKQSESIYRRHFFANPLSTSLL